MIESLVKVTLETDVICYLHTKQPESYDIIKKLKKKSENEGILLNDTTDVHYDIGQSFAYLYHLKNAEDFQNDSFQRIDDLPSFSSRCHRVACHQELSTDNDSSNISTTLASSSDLPLTFDNDYLNILNELNKLADVHLPCVDGHPYVDFVKKLRTMSDGTQILIYTPCRLKTIFQRLLYFDFIDQDIYIYPLLASRIASTNTVYS
ncbi:unnamed protein product [Rotaria magnacalcarata]|uniref:Uncharacterized protein n=1 Tax=Rotaria magnacalcarata TaxID=392030 RepID=A0A815KV01_9BILA|nr:unnamed protein product [Rotaria magnacalcarata]CAF1608127.1 unnamed protein product [Rotaria magnacalcarata]